MPTLVEITKSDVPSAWPNRDLRPISGTTLTPTFHGESLTRQQPIHLLFSGDRGLRDGDWKIVSFKSEPWELYNVKEDRTELNDIAAKHPQLVAKMVQKWTDMSRSILHASSATYAPVTPANATNTKAVHSNREWTKFDAAPPVSKQRNRSGAKKPIRARKNTELKVANGNLQLVFSGEDPGIAIDLRRESLPPGPYRVSFELNGGTTSGGELFFTTDQKTTLPKGKRIPFEVSANGKWQNIEIDMQTNKSIQQLRLDVSDGPGNASIRKFRLTDASGNTLRQWTK
jgi:arylsulfatase